MPAVVWGRRPCYVKSTRFLKIVILNTQLNMRHAESQLGNVTILRYNSAINKRKVKNERYD